MVTVWLVGEPGANEETNYRLIVDFDLDPFFFPRNYDRSDAGGPPWLLPAPGAVWRLSSRASKLRAWGLPLNQRHGNVPDSSSDEYEEAYLEPIIAKCPNEGCGFINEIDAEELEEEATRRADLSLRQLGFLETGSVQSERSEATARPRLQRLTDEEPRV